MESNTLANFAGIKQLQREILKNTKSLWMMDLNTLANIAAIKQLKLEVLKNIKSQYMKESNTRANIANCNYKATQKGHLKEHQESVH